MALNRLRDLFSRCTCKSLCHSKSPDRKAFSDKEAYQRRPRQYDEISDEQLQANNAARADVTSTASIGNYKRRPRDYDEIDMDGIQENCQTKQQQGGACPPPGSEGLNYVEVQIAAPQGAERRPNHGEPPTEYTTIAVSKQDAGPKVSIEG